VRRIASPFSRYRVLDRRAPEALGALFADGLHADAGRAGAKEFDVIATLNLTQRRAPPDLRPEWLAKIIGA
jgi:hypothetical protein